MKSHVIRKPVFVYKKLENQRIATLLLVPGTRTVRPVRANDTKKNRASQAFVVSIRGRDGHHYVEGRSWWDPKFQYFVGKVVRPTNGKFRVDGICNKGIHFYATEASV